MYLTFGKILGRFSDNGFLLLPDVEKNFTFYARDDAKLAVAKQKLRVFSLRDSYD